VGFTCGQQDGDQAPFSICECMNLRVAPSARTAHSLLFLIVVGATTKGEIEAAFEAMSEQHAGGLVVWQEPYFYFERTVIVALAARYAIPAIYGPRLFPEIGGLMSYGPNRDEMYRLTGLYAGKVLQGIKPADLPILQPSKFELVINLKTANTLGLAIPPGVLAIADEVIE
jgi:putative ABC transport system substrate-binding protein